MKCPFEKYVHKTMVCDDGCLGCSGTLQCPTVIFNKCQGEEDLTEADLALANKFISDHANELEVDYGS